MHRVAPGRPYRRGDRCRPFGVDVGDNDAPATGGDLLGHQSTEPAGGARHDDDLPPDMIIHCADRISGGGGDPVARRGVGCVRRRRSSALSAMLRALRLTLLGGRVTGDQSSSAKTFVLVHGGGHGGWCWQRMASVLRNHGHQV